MFLFGFGSLFGSVSDLVAVVAHRLSSYYLTHILSMSYAMAIPTEISAAVSCEKLPV